MESPGVVMPEVLGHELKLRLRTFTQGPLDLRQLTCFVEPHADSGRGGVVPLIDELLPALRAPATGPVSTYLVSGNSGFGKTTLSAYLCQRLWEEESDWLALYIHLPQIPAAKFNKLLDYYLKQGDEFDRAARRSIKGQGLILFLDGFDELPLNTRQDLESGGGLYTLNQWEQRHAPIKLVTLSRPAGYAHLDKSALFGRDYTHYALQTFTPADISQYIERYLAHPPSEDVLPPADWRDAGRYDVAIKALPGLEALVQTPFILSIVIKSLPTLVAQHGEAHTLTRSDIFKVFTEDWFTRHLSRKRPAYMRGLSNEVLRGYLKSYAENLARRALKRGQLDLTTLTLDQTRAPLLLEPRTREMLMHYQVTGQRFFRGELEYPPGRAWAKAVEPSSRAELARLRIDFIREGCLLHTHGNHYRFIHKSIVEYLAARDLFRGLQGSWDILLRAAAIDSQAFEAQGLNRNNLREEPEIVARLGEHIRGKPSAQALLGNLVLQSREMGGLETLASNAMTLMNHLGVDFSHQDFTNVQIPSADMRGSCCAYTNFSGSNLRDVWFHGALLTAASLEGANLQGTDFGESAPLVHGGAVNAVAHYFPPEGAPKERKGYWLTGCEDGYIYQWSGQGERLVRKMRHRRRFSRAGVTCLSVSSPQHLMASGGDDNIIWLWDLRRGRRLLKLSGHAEVVTSVSLSQAGELLASGSVDRSCRLWDLSTGKVREMLPGHASWVTSVSLSEASGLLVWGSDDETCRLWDVSKGEDPRMLVGHTEGVTSVSLSQDGCLLASGSVDAVCRLWDVSTGEVFGTLVGHTHDVTSVSLSQAGGLLASGSLDRTCRLWDLSTGEVRGVLGGHTDWITSVSLSQDGKLLASGSRDKTCRLWDVSRGEVREMLAGHTDDWSLTLSQAGGSLASGSKDNICRLWDVSTGEIRGRLAGHTDMVTSVSLGQDGKLLASGSRDKTCRLWDVSTGEVREMLAGHTDEVWSVSLSQDGSLLASGSADETCRLWNVMRSEIHATLAGHKGMVTSVALSKASDLLVSGSDDTTCRLWDISTGESRETLVGHTDRITSVSLSQVDGLLVSGSWDKTCRLWDVSTGEVRGTLAGHTNMVTSVSLSQDGRFLVSGSWDMTCRFWDLRQTREPLSILALGNEVHDVHFSLTTREFFVAYGKGISRLCYETLTGEHCLHPVKTYGTPKLWLTDARVTQAYSTTSSQRRLFEYHGAQGRPAPAEYQSPLAYSALFQPLAGTASAEAQAVWIQTEKRLTITEGAWVVSIARNLRKRGRGGSFFGGRRSQHAFLIIEGIRQYRHFILRAELTVSGKNPVQISLKPLDDIERFKDSAEHYEAQQWAISAVQGQKLIRNIQADQRRMLAYSLRGGGGVALDADYYNCITWAMKQLRELDDSVIAPDIRDRWYHFLMVLPADATREAGSDKGSRH